MAKSEIATIINGKELFQVTCDGCGEALYLVDAEDNLYNSEGQELSYREFRNMNVWVPDLPNDAAKAYCADCASNLVQCNECGEILERDEATFDSLGAAYCESCRDDVLSYCEHCNEWIRSETYPVTVSENGDVEEWCENCVDEDSMYCEHCEDRFSTDLGEYVDGYGWICNDCLENSDNYIRCDDCGRLIHVDDAHNTFDDDDDVTGTYCLSCYRRRTNEYVEVPGYHADHTPWKFENVDRTKHLVMGVEMEMERGGTNYKNGLAITEAMGISHKQGLCRMERDGSLTNGIEIISMPHTLHFFQKELKLEEGFAKAVQLGYRSHDGGNCGAHVHMDRTYFQGSMFNPEYAMIIIVQNNRDWLQKFSRREPDRMGYCRFYNDSRKFTPDDFKADEHGSTSRQEETRSVLKRMKDFYEGHGVALNFGGYSTMEVRFFRGTLKAQTLRANMEFVEMLGYAVKHFSDVQLCNVDFGWFKKFAKRKGYTNFLNYIEERGIIA